MLVNDADQAEEFEKRVLEWRSGQEQLVEWRKSTFDRISDFVCGLVDIAEPMRFVDNDKVPFRLLNVGLLRTRELVRADDDGLLLKWV